MASVLSFVQVPSSDALFPRRDVTGGLPIHASWSRQDPVTNVVSES